MPRRTKEQLTIWTRNLILVAVSGFLVNFGQGLLRGASTNFFVDTLGLSGKQVLWLTGIREIPGLGLMFIAALFMHFSLPRRTAISLLLMGIGYALYASVHSYFSLIAVALIASLGFHNWMPLQRALALSLTTKERSGRVLGALSAVGAVASIVGMGAIALFSKLFSGISLRFYYAIGGTLIALAALAILKIPPQVGATEARQPRMLLKKRYWLFYVLTLFEGSRMQVFGAFGTLVLVQNYGLEVWQISLLLLASSIVNFLAAPYLGYLLDRFGERLVLSTSYVLLALCFAGYATFHNAWALGSLLILINLLVILGMGLSTYVNRIAPPEELTPTLAAGVSINHITSVSISLIAGTLLQIVGYEALCWGAAVIIMLSVPFALALKTQKDSAPQLRSTLAE
ncbi:MAG: MFS transporter [Anaerolineae bacterium]|nr:MFS transporter [Anaerolineae bacterium]